MGYDELWDGFEGIVTKTEEGEKFSKELLKYFQKRQEIERDYAKSLTSLVEKLKGEEIGTLGDAWETLKEQTLAIANSRNKFCEEVESVCTQLSENIKLEKKDRSELVSRGNKLTKELTKADNNMKDARKAYVAARQKQEKAETAYEQGKQQASSSVGKLQKAVDKDTKKADKMDKEYAASVSTLCGVQDKFYDEDMPACLKDFEDFDVGRITSTQNVLHAFSNVQKNLGPEMIEACNNMGSVFEKIEGRSDTELYTDKTKNALPRPHAEYVSWEGEIKEVSATPVISKAPSEKKSKKADKKTSGGGAPPAPKNGPPPPGDLPPPPPAPGGTPAPIVTAVAPTVVAPAATVAPSITSNITTSAGGDDGEFFALYDYAAQDDDEISFFEGEIIILLEKDESGWWVGQNPRGEVGSFPSNYVEQALDEGEIIEIDADFRALYDYEAEDETELSIKAGDVLHVYTETDGWYFGSNSAGKQGNFPSNYMEAI